MKARIRSWAARIVSRLSGILRTDLPFFTEQVANRHPVGNWFELGNEFAKPLGKNFGPAGEIIIDPRRVHVMLEKVAPALPELFVEQSIDVVVMDRLESLEKLMGSVKEPRLIFRRKSVEIFQTDPPDPAKLGIFHEWLGD